MTIADDKATARKAAFQRRAQADPAVAETANSHLLTAIRALSGTCVSAYWPIRTELDPRPALTALLPTHALCLPVVQKAGQPLIFRHWDPDTPMIEDAFGVFIPEPETNAVPDILVVPMAAFDAQGYRLGYGGGFYDRTLAALRKSGTATAIGFAYDIQRCASVPRETTDEKLDLIVTETGIHRPA